MKALRNIVIFFAATFILLTAISFAISSMIDVEGYAPQIEEKLTQETGLKWQVDGPLKLSLFPAASLNVANIVARDEGGAKVAALAGKDISFEQATLKISWFPHIFSREIVVKQASLKSFSLSQSGMEKGMRSVINVDEFALHGLLVGFPKAVAEGEPPVTVAPYKSGQGLPISLAMSIQNYDANDKLVSDFAVGVSAQADMQNGGGAQIVDLKDLKLTAQEQSLTGNAQLKLGKGDPNVSFALAGKDIDANKILAALPKAEKTEPKAARPPAPLPKINLDGQVTIDKLAIDKLNIDKVDAKIIGQSGLYKIAPLAVNLYGGNITVQAEVNGKSVPAKCSANMKMSGLRAGDLATIYTGKDMFEGLAGGHSNIALPCLAGPVDVAAARGTGQFVIRDGVIKKWNISRALNQALSVAKAIESDGLGSLGAIEQAMSVRKGDDRFEFTEMTADYTLAHGLFNNNSLQVQAPLSAVDGNGTLNLVNKTIDYMLKLSLAGNGDGLTVPIKISGSIAEPSYKIDTAALLKSRIEPAIGDKIKDKIGGGEAGKKLIEKLPF